MQLNYTVVSATAEDFTVTAQVAGQDVQAKVPGLVVEMLSVDGSMGHTFRYMPEDVAAELAKFPVGASVTVTLTPDD